MNRVKVVGALDGAAANDAMSSLSLCRFKANIRPDHFHLLADSARSSGSSLADS